MQILLAPKGPDIIPACYCIYTFLNTWQFIFLLSTGVAVINKWGFQFLNKKKKKKKKCSSIYQSLSGSSLNWKLRVNKAKKQGETMSICSFFSFQRRNTFLFLDNFKIRFFLALSCDDVFVNGINLPRDGYSLVHTPDIFISKYNGGFDHKFHFVLV